MSDTQHESETTTWPDLAEGLYAFLTGRGATIEYDFKNLEVLVPRSASDSSPAAKWQLNGALHIRTSEQGR